LFFEKSKRCFALFNVLDKRVGETPHKTDRNAKEVEWDQRDREENEPRYRLKYVFQVACDSGGERRIDLSTEKEGVIQQEDLNAREDKEL